MSDACRRAPAASAQRLRRRRWRRALLRFADELLSSLAYTMPGHLPAPRPSALTDEELWDEWRRSAASLSRPASTAETLAVVERRQQYLDEIEKRDPSVFVPRVTGGIALDWDDVIRLLDS